MANIFACAYWQNSYYYYYTQYNKNSKQMDKVLPF